MTKTNGAQFIFPTVEFQIIANTTKADGTKSSVEISKFGNYMECIMVISSGLDPSKITLGIVFNQGGTYYV